MKRILLAAALIIGTSHAATAQTSGNSSGNAPSVSSSRAKAKTGKSKKNQQRQSDSLNQRDMYKGENGQRATLTGHEATGTNGNAAPLPKKASSDTTRREE